MHIFFEKLYFYILHPNLRLYYIFTILLILLVNLKKDNMSHNDLFFL